MSQHVLFVDSEDLWEIKWLDLPFLKSFAADSSIDHFFIIFVVLSDYSEELFFSHGFGFELIEEFGSEVLKFFRNWIINSGEVENEFGSFDSILVVLGDATDVCFFVL